MSGERARRSAVIVGFTAALCCLFGSFAAAASAQRVIVSPLPGTSTALPQTQISFLGAAIGDLSRISVVGSSTGGHSGQLRAYGGLTGTSFVPSKPFRGGELVAVVARLKTRTVRTTFRVAVVAPVPLGGFPGIPAKPGDVLSFRSRPDLQPPKFTVSTPASSSAQPGDIFATPSVGPGQHGPMILDGSGALVWSHPEPTGTDAADLSVQSYQGRRVLTWWEGKIIKSGFGRGQDVVLGEDYRPVARISAGNGLQADLHEFRITPQGTALITAFSPVRADLSSAKGPRRGVALDGVIQEIDIATGLVVWEWHSLSAVAPSASYMAAPKSSRAAYDYFHVNSVFVDRVGNLLVSARNTSGVYLVSRRTGGLIWRLGGKQSTFKLGPGVPFAYQHDAELAPHGTISLFDDEGAPPVKPPSAGEIIRLSFSHRTASLVRRFVHRPPLLTGSQGNLQVLPNGDRLVGWGGLPNITQFDRHGRIVFDGHFPEHENSYRAFRATWAGQPTDAPSLAITPGPPGNGTAYVSWNGATQVAAWRLLAGPTASTLAPVATAPRTGFETAIALPPGAAAAQVQALGSNGEVLGSSNAAS
ncbi:MAG: arylsulfotransferase family protein [Solirubrobacteraceae bacterium]